MTQLQIRNLLASAGFRGEDVFLPGSSLSGGEIAKLHLARISLERPNLLLLDEPSNHLDIYSKEILTSTLEQYKGTLIVVSHDRYLLMRLNARILLLDGFGAVKFFESFADYRSYLNEEKQTNNPKEEQQEEGIYREGISQKEQRRFRAEHRQRMSFLEESISKIEKRIEGLQMEAQEENVLSDYQRLQEIYSEIDELRVTLAEYSDEWMRHA